MDKVEQLEQDVKRLKAEVKIIKERLGDVRLK